MTRIYYNITILHTVTITTSFILLLTCIEANIIPQKPQQQVPSDNVYRENTVEKTLKLLQKTLTSLDKGLDYMTEQHRNINLDGIIGTRFVEGQLKVLLNHIVSGDYPEVSNDVNIQIRELIQKASDVSGVATFFVKILQPEYYHRISGIIMKDFWMLDYPNRVTDPSYIQTPLYDGEAMSERESDNCLTELLGTSGKTTEQCVISPHCWNQMTAPGYRFYSLSHQLFYLQIGESIGCFRGSFLESTKPLVETYCASMLQEAEDIQQAGYPVIKRDLFMEQQALCGMSGYQDFFRTDWLEKILSWQWDQGCWGEHNVHNDQFVKAKREEKVLAGGCESHRTAVAIGALTEYVRYLIDYVTSFPDNKETEL